MIYLQSTKRRKRSAYTDIFSFFYLNNRNNRGYIMANPHPNTSGIEKYNFKNLDPDTAKRIRRLGGLALARQRDTARSNAYNIESVKSSYEKRNHLFDLDRIFYHELYDALMDPNTTIGQKIRIKEYLDKQLDRANRLNDKYNVLQYQTSKPEYQLSGSYMDLLSGEDQDILSIQNEEEMYNAEQMEKSYNEEQEYFASLNDETTTNAPIDAGIPCSDTTDLCRDNLSLHAALCSDTNITDTDINTDTNSDKML